MIETPELEPLDTTTLLRLPKHLKKTAVAILKCTADKVTADDIAETTRRARSVESRYLNQLVVKGHLKKKRKGRKTYFTLTDS